MRENGLGVEDTPSPREKKEVECGLGNGFQRMLPESNKHRVSSMRYQDSK